MSGTANNVFDVMGGKALWKCWSAIDARGTLELSLPQFRLFLKRLAPAAIHSAQFDGYSSL